MILQLRIFYFPKDSVLSRFYYVNLMCLHSTLHFQSQLHYCLLVWISRFNHKLKTSDIQSGSTPNFSNDSLHKLYRKTNPSKKGIIVAFEENFLTPHSCGFSFENFLFDFFGHQGRQAVFCVKYRNILIRALCSFSWSRWSMGN